MDRQEQVVDGGSGRSSSAREQRGVAMPKDTLTIVLIIVVLYLLFTKQSGQPMSNEETWHWVDYAGHERTMTVNRSMHR